MLTSFIGAEDKLIWHYDQFGRYTIRNGYFVAKSIRESMNSGGGTYS